MVKRSNKILVTGVKSDIQINSIVAINRAIGWAKDVRVISLARKKDTTEDIQDLGSNGAYVLEQIWEVPELIFNIVFFEKYECKVYFGYRGPINDIPQNVRDLFEIIIDLEE